MSTAAVIVAAGRGMRAGGGLPKQWRDLGGLTVAARTLAAFRTAPGIDRVMLVLNRQDMGLAPGYEAHPDVWVTQGGDSRAASVLAGLTALEPFGCTRVLIHDVARPLVSQALIARVLAALDRNDAAAPALAVTDALWRGKGDFVTGLQDRTGLYRAQTPQGFTYSAILHAHRTHGADAADDVEIARAVGLDVAIVEGEDSNIKITTAGDFARAERMLGDQMDIRTGTGFDVHSFGPGNHVTLCGVQIAHDRALTGHSDADVGMHALTDAIYGALAEGDIGRHFPPSDPQWKGADSRIFLDHAVDRISARGFVLSNADITLICETPKITPHAAAMVTRLASILEVAADRISVKATTTERLGFTGRGEGIAAMATVTLVQS